MMWIEWRNLEYRVENDVDGTEKPGTRSEKFYGWDGKPWNNGWRLMYMGRRNLEHGEENDVDGTEKPGTMVGD